MNFDRSDLRVVLMFSSADEEESAEAVDIRLSLLVEVMLRLDVR